MTDYRVVPDSARAEVLRGRPATEHQALVAALVRGEQRELFAQGANRKLGRLHLAAEQDGYVLRSSWTLERNLNVWFDALPP
jgi:hypothetical protein